MQQVQCEHLRTVCSSYIEVKGSRVWLCTLFNATSIYCTFLLMSRRQLAEVRKRGDKSGGARVVEAEKKLIICAVKKPLKLSEPQDGESRVFI